MVSRENRRGTARGAQMRIREFCKGGVTRGRRASVARARRGTAPPCPSPRRKPIDGGTYGRPTRSRVRIPKTGSHAPRGHRFHRPGLRRRRYPGNGIPLCPNNPEGVAPMTPPRRNTQPRWGCDPARLPEPRVGAARRPSPGGKRSQLDISAVRIDLTSKHNLEVP